MIFLANIVSQPYHTNNGTSILWNIGNYSHNKKEINYCPIKPVVLQFSLGKMMAVVGNN